MHVRRRLARRQCAPMQQPRRQSTDSSRRAIYIYSAYIIAAETGHAELLCRNHRTSVHRIEVEIVRNVEEHDVELPYALASLAFDLHGHLRGVVDPRGTGPPLRRSSAALPNCNWRLCHPWRLCTIVCHKRQSPDARLCSADTAHELKMLQRIKLTDKEVPD